MSALGQDRPISPIGSMSAYPPIASAKATCWAIATCHKPPKDALPPPDVVSGHEAQVSGNQRVRRNDTSAGAHKISVVWSGAASRNMPKFANSKGRRR
jgi:hypothetical protein